MQPGHGFANLGADWSSAGLEGFAEAGIKEHWGDIFGRAWVNQDSGGVGVGVRW